MEDIKKMPQELMNIPPQVRKCSLAYIKSPSMNHAIGEVTLIYKIIILSKSLKFFVI
jgi:hypothetical protein